VSCLANACPSRLAVFVQSSRTPPYLPSFPTRRSSDLLRRGRRDRLRQHPDRHRRRQLNAQDLDHGEEAVTATQHTPVNTDSLPRSEEHTSELQSRFDLVCRLLLEKKNTDDMELASCYI